MNEEVLEEELFDIEIQLSTNYITLHNVDKNIYSALLNAYDENYQHIFTILCSEDDKEYESHMFKPCDIQRISVIKQKSKRLLG